MSNGNGQQENGHGFANGNGYKVPAPRAEWIVKRRQRLRGPATRT